MFLAHEEKIFSAAGSPYRIPMMLECLVLCASIYLLIQLLVKNTRYNMLEIKEFRLPLLFFPFIFCLTMLFINENLRFNNDMFYNVSFYIEILLNIVLMAMWLLWTWIQHAQMQLHLKLEQERELRELEHFQYQEMLKKREHLDRICKDYRVQLQVIQSMIRQRQMDYLAIRTVNASDVPDPTPRPGHGLGTRILTEIAHKREGQYVTLYKYGEFVATVLLKVGV